VREPGSPLDDGRAAGTSDPDDRVRPDLPDSLDLDLDAARDERRRAGNLAVGDRGLEQIPEGRHPRSDAAARGDSSVADRACDRTPSSAIP